jgi:hypothetical protein
MVLISPRVSAAVMLRSTGSPAWRRASHAVKDSGVTSSSGLGTTRAGSEGKSPAARATSRLCRPGATLTVVRQPAPPNAFGAGRVRHRAPGGVRRTASSALWGNGGGTSRSLIARPSSRGERSPAQKRRFEGAHGSRYPAKWLGPPVVATAASPRTASPRRPGRAPVSVSSTRPGTSRELLLRGPQSGPPGPERGRDGPPQSQTRPANLTGGVSHRPDHAEVPVHIGVVHHRVPHVSVRTTHVLSSTPCRIVGRMVRVRRRRCGAYGERDCKYDSSKTSLHVSSLGSSGSLPGILTDDLAS